MDTSKSDLYNEAKDAYYNGEPIMSDLEFDELEIDLGLENQGYVGTHHQKSYTIKHPILMGSLSKIQVKFDENGVIDFNKYKQEILNYLKKSLLFGEEIWEFEITPKYDGCSFEAVINYDGTLISCSTRGDGEYGKDIKVWFETEWTRNYQPKMRNWIDRFKDNIDAYSFLKYFIIRGECLINKDTFMSKYSQDFTIPRSFVAGCLGQDWLGTPKQIEMREDLSWVCYDYREYFDNDVCFEIDYDDSFPGVISDFRNKFKLSDLDGLDHIYEDYEHYRNVLSPYTLDGFVVKPYVDFRLNDNTRPRQEDCVAVKFTPEIVKSTIQKIEWNVGKTGEFFPTGICEEVILGGKKVNRVSLHNYDWMLRNKCMCGSVVEISLAGDIIPSVISVMSTSEVMTLPDEEHYTVKDEKSGCVHLMKQMTEQEKRFYKFINSVKVLKPNGIGEKVAEMLFYVVGNGEYDNILELMTLDGLILVTNTLDDSKSSMNIIESLRKRGETLSLPDIVESCGFENCGPKNSLWLAKKISGVDVPDDGIPTSIIELWDFRSSHNLLDDVERYVKEFKIPYIKETKNKDVIPVILTGDTSNTQYPTKKQWLLAHPQYVETTSWKECKILFTNSLESNSSKMVKARKKNIPIKLYED